MELIDKKSVLKKIYLAGEAIKEYSGRFYEGKFNGLQCAYEIINDMSTVEERKHGHWEGGGAYYCSNCNAYAATDVFGGGLDITEQHYCYNCGAIMDGKAICND